MTNIPRPSGLVSALATLAGRRDEAAWTILIQEACPRMLRLATRLAELRRAHR